MGLRGTTNTTTSSSSNNKSFSPTLAPAPVPMKRGEGEVALRVYWDKSVVEVFAMGGRTALTTRVYPRSQASDGIAVGAAAAAVGVATAFVSPAAAPLLTARANATVNVSNLEVYTLRGIWRDPSHPAAARL